jgi:ribonuclease R
MTKKKSKVEEAPIPKKTAKEEKLFQNLLKITRQFMQGKGFTSLTEGELFQRLSFPPQHLPLFREILAELLREGTVSLSGGRYSWKKVEATVATGTLRVHPRGFGFLQADDPVLYPQDIFIPKHLTQNAVVGDTVEVQVNTDVIWEKGPEGRVTAILSRGRTHMAGIIREAEAYEEMIAYVPLLGASQRVIVEPPTERKLRVGDRIVMEVVEWGDKSCETRCRMSHYLGHISDPSCDIPAAIEEYGLRSDFSSRVVAEAQEWGTQVSRKEIAQREDLREWEIFTIDPETAKDFDDALNVSKDSKGHYHLGVHIADVSHYVHPGTELDNEAQKRCNSTYFPGHCLPMLPRELSDNLCSLKENVNRLTLSVLMEFDGEGNMLHYRIARTVIKSVKRFSYREAKAVLDGKKSKHLPTLQLMVELCGLLKRKRYERGSIEFSLPDLVVIVDEKGMPYKTDYVAYDITHQLVEEFMLKANEVVASHLSEQGKNLTYRVHDEPAEENMRDFSLLAGAFGFKLSDKPTPVDLQKFFDEALSTSYGPYLATSYIRRMRLAIYSPDNIGHYGLGLTHYCHFTSPIRRYVDLVVHRILFGESDERLLLEKIALRASEQERISAKAENSVVLLKKLRLLEQIQAKEPNKQYEAVVTRVKPFGFFFEVLELMIEGFFHVSQLESDYYVFDEAGMRLCGANFGGGYASGDKLLVMLKSANLILLETEWNIVRSEGSATRKEGVGRRGTSRRGGPQRRPFIPPKSSGSRTKPTAKRGKKGGRGKKK